MAKFMLVECVRCHTIYKRFFGRNNPCPDCGDRRYTEVDVDDGEEEEDEYR